MRAMWNDAGERKEEEEERERERERSARCFFSFFFTSFIFVGFFSLEFLLCSPLSVYFFPCLSFTYTPFQTEHALL